MKKLFNNRATHRLFTLTIMSYLKTMFFMLQTWSFSSIRIRINTLKINNLYIIKLMLLESGKVYAKINKNLDVINTLSINKKIINETKS